MAIGFVLSLLAVAVAAAFYFVRSKFLFFEELGFLYRKPQFPFGNLKGVGTKIHMVEALDDLYKEMKGKAVAFGMFFSVKPIVTITDLDVVKHILIKDFDNFHNRGVYQ